MVPGAKTTQLLTVLCSGKGKNKKVHSRRALKKESVGEEEPDDTTPSGLSEALLAGFAALGEGMDAMGEGDDGSSRGSDGKRGYHSTVCPEFD